MKNLAHLLLVLSLIGFSACGKKKNKTDEVAATNAFCYGTNCSTSGYNGQSVNSTQGLLNVLNSSNAGFPSQTHATVSHAFVTGTVSYDTDEVFGISWLTYNTSDFNQSSSYNVVSNSNGNVSSNPYGSTYQAIANNLKSAVSSSVGMQQIQQSVYKVKTSSGDVIYIDFGQPISANPTQVEKNNGELTYRTHSYVGF